MSGTAGYAWIRPHERSQDGRATWTALIVHYEGGAQKEKCTATALAILKALHYKNASLFAWEDFSCQLLNAYEGGAQKEKCTATPLAILKAQHYKNASLFAWEDFSCQLLNAYRDLDGTRDEITPYNKVKEMLAKIDLDTPRIEVAKAHI